MFSFPVFFFSFFFLEERGGGEAFFFFFFFLGWGIVGVDGGLYAGGEICVTHSHYPVGLGNFSIHLRKKSANHILCTFASRTMFRRNKSGKI